MSALDFAEFSPFEMEKLLITIEESLRVYKRSQFFLWAQGGLQNFLPHETLVCAWGDILGNRFQHEVFSRSARSSHAAKEFVAAKGNGSALSKMILEWQRKGFSSFLYDKDDTEEVPDDHPQNLLRRGAGHAIAHGAKEMQGDNGSFFLFLGLDQRPGPRDAYLVELLMPYLHMATYRMVGWDEPTNPGDTAEDASLSGREIEVLRWVREGKTNQEIALILSISPLTVKNHVQNILRKLNVTNRAQAVAKGMGSNLFIAEDAV